MGEFLSFKILKIFMSLLKTYHKKLSVFTKSLEFYDGLW